MEAILRAFPAREPELIELVGGPEFFISGTTTRRDGEVIHIICYVERQCEGRIERHEVLRCHMGAAQYHRNFLIAFERMKLNEIRGHH